MRTDSVGFFWNDSPVPRPPKPQTPKRTPPERTWERPDYLPGLEEALRFPVPYMTDHDLMSEIGGELYFDIECYWNFFQIAFMSKKTGKVIDFILAEDCDWYLDMQRLKWMCENFTFKGFNSNNYDIPILSFALAGADNRRLKEVTNQIINEENEELKRNILRANKIPKTKVDHIDLKEVAPLFASLKIYGGRVHTKKMQDLPFHPETVLSDAQMAIVRWYCINDLRTTQDVDHTLEEQQKLRLKLSQEIGTDLRSKSDAQIAEAVIVHEVHIRNKFRSKRPEIPIGTVYRYKPPAYMGPQNPWMRNVIDIVKNTMFIVDETGSIGQPPELDGLRVTINNGRYTMGIGGLHSTEKKVARRAINGYQIFDIDAESYYPRIMLNLGLYPEQLGPAFLEVFNTIVERRLAAKHAGDKATADSLKITINGTFGKLGNMYSVLYAPDLLIQVTLTGQLSILMLIEMFECYGIEVISANTDGIAVRVHESNVHVMHAILKQWEQMVQFKTEINEYVGLYSKDVNNYIAVKKDGTVKGKGLYANPWATAKNAEEKLRKNPAGSICVDAVTALLVKGVPIRTTIYNCRDFTKFVAVRHVKGGAVKDGVYLGKAVRWYYALNQTTEMLSAETGNKIPKSDGAKPCMVLPEQFPDDVDFEWYVEEAEKILKGIGYYED
jgi:hypothetical protein